MIKPPWIPTGIKGLRASAATLRDDGLTVALPSHGRFECDFEAMYAMRVLQRQARWYAVLDGISRTVGLVSATVFVAAFCLEHYDLAVYSGALLMLTLVLQAMIRPRTQWAESIGLRSAFVSVRTEAARLTDRQYAQRLRELQEPGRVNIWRWIAKSACSDVCEELGCAGAGSVPVSRREVPRISSASGSGRGTR